MQANTCNVLISCADSPGIIYRVSKIFYELGFNIITQNEFVDHQNLHFFMRSKLTCTDPTKLENLCNMLRDELKDAQIKIAHSRKKDVVIFCTKEIHCLGDILLRHFSGELALNIKAIISNYRDLNPLAQKFDIPFFFIPNEENRENQEDKMLEILMGLGRLDYLILAKFMRILSPSFIAHFPHQIINIHHSFLPAFIGANPYKQAYERGVKIIGASAHFVTEKLDEGPIITQDTIAIDHTFLWQDMQNRGRDIEKIVLAHAIDLAIQDRIFLHKNKTIIL